MGNRELLQALEDEVGRQIGQLQSEAAQERERLLDATRRELAGAREAALGSERRRLADEAARALADARRDEERAVLGQARAVLDALEREAETRLAALGDGATTERLLDEIALELGEGPVELRVPEGLEPRLEDHLRRKHPQLLPRVKVEGSSEVTGGVVASLGGRQTLDNTLRSRLRKAWPLLEPEIAARLFQGEGASEPAAGLALVGEGDGRV